MSNSKSIPNALPTKPYVDYVHGHGILGLTLTLNLAQCQKLKDLHNQALVILNTQEDSLTTLRLVEDAKDYIVELMPLLQNFEIFDSPNDKDLF